MKSQKGFTLIEILVVVLIISVLSGLVLGVVNSSGIRSKARDAQRKADLKQIQTALELYFADNRRYPPSGSSGSAWQQVNNTNPAGWMEHSLENGGYINDVPVDPMLSGTHPGPCNDPTVFRSNFRTNAAGSVYVLTSLMEIVTSNDDSECSSLNNWGSLSNCGSPFATVDYCYGVENP